MKETRSAWARLPFDTGGSSGPPRSPRTDNSRVPAQYGPSSRLVSRIYILLQSRSVTIVTLTRNADAGHGGRSDLSMNLPDRKGIGYGGSGLRCSCRCPGG